MPLQDIYKEFETAITEATQWFRDEIANMRTSRVTPNLVESIQVEHYGTRTPLNGLASISNVDARTLIISPWDKSAITPIEKALTNAQLGANPTVDGEVIRLAFSGLNEEMRDETAKQLHKKAEEARVRFRQARDEALSHIKQKKTDGRLTEDDFYNGKEELDKRINKANQAIEDLATKKETEIRQV